jgi:KAP family P-loop domain
MLAFIDAQVIGGFIALIASIISGIRAFGNSLLPGSPNVASQFVKKTSDPMEKLKSHFEDMVHQIQYPVAIFVDDLDRCQDEYAVEFLEGVQTVFRKAGVVFVVSADRRWLYASYQKIYSTFSEALDDIGRPLGYLFLDKIFQISVSLPKLSTTYQEKYLDYLFTMDESKAEKGKEIAIEEAESEVRSLTHSEIVTRLKFWSGDPIKERAFREAVVTRFAQPEVEEMTEHFLRKFAPLIERNPRSMKRLVTAYGLWRAKDILAGSYIEENRLAQWVIVTLRWPLVAHFLEENPDVADLLIKDEAKKSSEGRANEEPKLHSPILENRGIAPEMQKMLLDPLVNAVLLGKQMETPLDRRTIEKLTTL